jgi:uncharacterized membrane protein YgaE (UPF0421/DUF939 family)
MVAYHAESSGILMTFKPTMFAAVITLGLIAYVAMTNDMNEVATACVGGVVAALQKMAGE